MKVDPTTPLHELKHDPVPGYPKAFLIAFALMAGYLALVLITSPGKAEKHHPPKPKSPPNEARAQQ